MKTVTQTKTKRTKPAPTVKDLERGAAHIRNQFGLLEKQRAEVAQAREALSHHTEGAELDAIAIKALMFVIADCDSHGSTIESALRHMHEDLFLFWRALLDGSAALTDEQICDRVYNFALRAEALAEVQRCIVTRQHRPAEP